MTTFRLMTKEVDIHKVLRAHWGFDSFRNPQEEIIRSVLSGIDTLALLPTGGGKSLCYQLPAMALPHNTLVISPLIALMLDQVAGLESKGVRSIALHSGMSRREVDIAIDNWIYGPTKILFVAPERINSPMFWERLKKVKLSLIAVDEAHCISQWGYDFRPAYFDIVKLREIHRSTPILALTATATELVVDDIKAKLAIHKEATFKKSFKRENLSITILPSNGKEASLLNILQKLHGTGIIYQRNRRQTREVAELLASKGYRVTYYHGGLPHKERSCRQAQWMDGEVDIIVCTNAFGMGIDKPDVRFVVHLDIPPSLEDYYQEIGRAGRDGEPSKVIAILGTHDYEVARHNFSTSFYPLRDIYRIYHKICKFLSIPVGSGEMEVYDFDPLAFAEKSNVPVRLLWRTLEILQKEGWIALCDGITQPSTVQVLVQGWQINEMLRDQREKQEIVRELLRRYEGLFSMPVSISEQDLAKSMGQTEYKVNYLLKQLRREGIIAYEPGADGARLTMLRERLSAANFRLDEQRYHLRKDRAKLRLETIIDFLKASTCRQELILDYFGEKSKGPCGHCDNCQSNTLPQFSEEEIEKVERHIMTTVDNSDVALTASQYLARYPLNKRSKAVAIIRHLRQSGIELPLLAIEDAIYE